MPYSDIVLTYITIKFCIIHTFFLLLCHILYSFFISIYEFNLFEKFIFVKFMPIIFVCFHLK